jgi:hypothetical protein
MKIFEKCIAHGEVYAIRLFGKFIDFRQWYYVWYDGEKSDSWLTWFELRNDIKRLDNKIYFKPIPKFKSMFQ